MVRTRQVVATLGIGVSPAGSERTVNLGEADFIALRVFFELLAEWEVKENSSANFN